MQAQWLRRGPHSSIMRLPGLSTSPWTRSRHNFTSASNLENTRPNVNCSVGMTGSCSESFDKSVYNLPSSSPPCASSISKAASEQNPRRQVALPPEKASSNRFFNREALTIGHVASSNPTSSAPPHIKPSFAKSLRVSIVPIPRISYGSRTVSIWSAFTFLRTWCVPLGQNNSSSCTSARPAEAQNEHARRKLLA